MVYSGLTVLHGVSYREMMLNILFCHAKKNEALSYKQVLAVLQLCGDPRLMWSI